ncbi:hypothetical protein ACTZWW_14575 [Salinarimonas sp. NSM]|uniref:hypothetical protein n=1 Tax=Salinarimonas sp. NSM TaxID=3458003 RepID=UPI004035DB20
MPCSIRTASSAATLAASFALVAAPALAMDPVGTIAGTLDGEAREWRTLSVPSEGTTTANLQSFGPVTMVSIQGHDAESGSIMRGVLSIELGLMGTDASAMRVDESVGYYPDGMSGPFWVAGQEGGPLEIAFDTLALTGDPAAAGTVTADLCRKEGMFDPADTSDCIRLEARFETPLSIEE